jgi:hypothetical protein
MSDARITLSELGSHPPYYQDTKPQLVEVSGRASRGCLLLSVAVRTDIDTGVIFSRDDVVPIFQSVPAGADPMAPEYDGAWTASFAFDPQDMSYLVVRCGASLFVEAKSLTVGVDGDVEQLLELRCKGVPAGGYPGQSGPGTGPDDGWPWPSPPSIMCRIWRSAYGAALTSTFGLIAAAATWPTTPWFTALGADAVLTAAALALWQLWCRPPRCEVWGVVCWAAKNAAIFALGIAIVAMSARGLIAVALLGGIAAMAIARLDEYRCPVPSAGPWPY